MQQKVSVRLFGESLTRNQQTIFCSSVEPTSAGVKKKKMRRPNDATQQQRVRKPSTYVHNWVRVSHRMLISPERVLDITNVYYIMYIGFDRVENQTSGSGVSGTFKLEVAKSCFG